MESEVNGSNSNDKSVREHTSDDLAVRFLDVLLTTLIQLQPKYVPFRRELVYPVVHSVVSVCLCACAVKRRTTCTWKW